MEKKRSYVQLLVKEDGTYLKLVPNVCEESPITIDEVLEYLHLVHVRNYDRAAVVNLLQQGASGGIVKIDKEPIPPVDETMQVRILEDELVATAIFYPPSNQGKKLTKEKVYELLERAGVRKHIIDSVITMVQQEQVYNVNVCIARGIEPVPGCNGRIEYNFARNVVALPKINEDGTVDYRHLDRIRHVEEGELIASIVPGVPGKGGELVTGKVVPPPKVKTPVLKYGRNIRLSEDGNHLYSEISGHVYEINGKVYVSNMYEVPGDVNAATGNIDFNGDIIVKGNVVSGYSLRATGQIIVEGVAEAATLLADGPIVVKGGIQGMNKGEIRSGANITTKFIENAVVYAEDSVYAEVIMHSKVTAKYQVEALGKKGMIVGSKVNAGEKVSFKIAGTDLGAFTQIEVGIEPKLMEKYRSCIKDSKKLVEEHQSLKQILLASKQKLEKGMTLNQTQLDTVRNIAHRMKSLEKELRVVTRTRDEIGEMILQCSQGCVIANDKIYQGVKIVIGGVTLITSKNLSHCKLTKKDGDIEVLPM